MARPRQYGDPISVPFRPEIKNKIVQLADQHNVAQVDIIRAAVTHEFLETWEHSVASRTPANKKETS